MVLPNKLAAAETNSMMQPVFTGVLPTICYAAGVASFLYQGNIWIFDYCGSSSRCATKSACAGAGARRSGEHLANAHISKEKMMEKVLERRGANPAWCISCPRWTRVRATSPGMTSRATRPCCSPSCSSPSLLLGANPERDKGEGGSLA